MHYTLFSFNHYTLFRQVHFNMYSQWQKTYEYSAAGPELLCCAVSPCLPCLWCPQAPADSVFIITVFFLFFFCFTCVCSQREVRLHFSCLCISFSLSHGLYSPHKVSLCPTVRQMTWSLRSSNEPTWRVWCTATTTSLPLRPEEPIRPWFTPPSLHWHPHTGPDLALLSRASVRSNDHDVSSSDPMVCPNYSLQPEGHETYGKGLTDSHSGQWDKQLMRHQKSHYVVCPPHVHPHHVPIISWHVICPPHLCCILSQVCMLLVVESLMQHVWITVVSIQWHLKKLQICVN